MGPITIDEYSNLILIIRDECNSVILSQSFLGSENATERMYNKHRYTTVTTAILVLPNGDWSYQSVKEVSVNQ